MPPANCDERRTCRGAAPPKTQAAPHQLATQNPIEQEGTYHLPEAKLDRFIYELRIGYPIEAEEEEIVSTTTGVMDQKVRPVLTAAQVLEM